MVRKIVHLRWKQRLGPVEIAGRLGHAGLDGARGAGAAAGSTGSRTSTGRTGEPIRRYEHDHPGSLMHVDVKKLGNIPDGGGWRYVGRAAGQTATGQRTPGKPPQAGTATR